MQRYRHIGKYFPLGFAIICGVILLDQYTKWLVMEAMLRQNGPVTAGFIEWFTTQQKIEFFFHERERFNSIALLPFLSLVMVWNQGISFGMLDTNAAYMPFVLIALSLIISLMMMMWLALTSHKISAIAISLIVGGAVGNVIDRVRFGAVADFIDLYVGKYHWPAFNVADSCIVIGAVILMFSALLSKESV